MAGDGDNSGNAWKDLFGEMLKLQADAAETLFAQFGQMFSSDGVVPGAAMKFDPARWTALGEQLRVMWASAAPDETAMKQAAKALSDPQALFSLAQDWYRQMPFATEEERDVLWRECQELWNGVFGKAACSGAAGSGETLPRRDKRFADPRWREQPVYALIHQSYLLYAEQLARQVEKVPGLDSVRREQARFAVRVLIEALSPANFPLTNPVVVDRTIETGGQNLVCGMEHLLADLERGQLTHTDPEAFELGRNLAVTPGKVVYETPLFQLIQYSPATPAVLAVPLVIFPPWINRFYILDLNPGKSFVRWAVSQGITTFIVSWKSADDTMTSLTWDDYIRAQIEAIDHVRARLKVAAVHTIGYCVAGTTLAATLAILARRGEADKVKSATFFTAQVDFEKAGELKNFIDSHQIAAVEAISRDGFLDGRYMAAAFNMLRGTDLIWSYVINNYLLGEDYPAFDLLHWNSDTTNLPARWLHTYLEDLYRNNLLVEPDRLQADGTSIDLRRIAVPAFIQAGREDHIAPAESVWRMTEHLSGPWTFLLAGSGHIAGVINPPASGKYQYWTNPGPAASLAAFIADAEEHPGSWWNHWFEWLLQQDDAKVPATGRRKPGGQGDDTIEDAPGRYVKLP